MAWLYLPESVVLNSASDSRSVPNVTELSVTLNGKVTPRPLSWRGWQRRKWTTRLSGTTLKRSTADRGAALWISSLRDTRANLSVTQDSNAERQTQDTCFRTSRASSESAHQHSAFLKTWERTFGLDSEKSSPIWKVYITMLRRDYSRRSRWARRMSVNGSLSWRSPNARDAEKWHYRHKGNNPNGKQINLSGEALNWATPNAAMTIGETNPNLARRGKKFYNQVTGREVQTALSTEARHWKTSQGTDGVGGIMELRENANAHLKLRDTAVNWQSPNVGDSKGRAYQLTLVGESQNWNSPTAHAHKLGSLTLTATGETKGRLENQNLIFQPSPQDLTNTTNGKASLLDFLSLLPPSKKRLNPTFTEWLMGLPLGWTNPDTKTNLPSWEMQFRQLLRHLLSAYWQSGLE